MKAIFAALVLYLAALAQMMLGPRVAILGVEPDIVFAAVVALSAVYGFLGGALAGAGIGFYLDLLFLCPGFYSLQYILGGGIAGLVSGGGQKRGRVAQALIISLPAYLVKELSILLNMYLERVAFNWVIIIEKVVIGAGWTAVWTLGLYFLAIMFIGGPAAARGKGGLADGRQL